MGQEITYCSKCQSQLRSSDFDKGRAVRIDGVNYCAACAPKPAPPPVGTVSERGLSVTPASGTRRAAGPQQGSPAMFALIGIAAVLLLGVVAVSGSGGKAAPPRESKPAAGPLVVDIPAPRPESPQPLPVAPAVPVVPVVRKSDTAKESLRKAREFAQAHPADWAGQLSLYDQAAWDARETEFLEAARSEREAVVKRRREVFAAQAKILDDAIRPRVEREEFAAAIAAWKEARSAQSSPDWTAMIDKNAADVRARADALFAALKGKGTPAAELRERVAKWGLPDLEKQIVDAPPPVEPPRPAPVPEAEVVQKNWRLAMDLASARDYAGAIKELERARQEAPSAAHKSELTADLEVLRALAAAVDDVGKSLAKLPKGQKVALGYVNESGQAQRIEGTVVRADPLRMIVKSGEEIAVVPLAELTAGCLAELMQSRGGGRPGYLVCCLEGELEGIKKPPSEALPPKYGALAASVAQRAADPEVSKRELEARRLFAAADAEAGVPSTAAAGVEKLAQLQKDWGDTGYVRRNMLHIRVRMEAGKEFVFHPEMAQVSGTFKPSKSAKAGACWTSDADSPAANRKDNTVDLDFMPLPSLDYRCWVYVGACCGETFEFFYQATDLAGFEPGSATLAPVKHSISSAVRKHSAHNGPKQPSRWGWASLPLPKFSTPGVKKVRLLTDQQGFSVAFAVVSAVRTAPPTEAEVREWERIRAAEPPKFPSDPTLVAYYGFDNGTGTTAVDLTRYGNHGKLMNGAAWAPGKFGKAVDFDGVGAYIKIPTSASFDSCSKQITIAVWAYRKSVLPNSRILVGRQLGSAMDDQWAFCFQNDGGGFNMSPGPGKGLTTVALPGNQWIHLAVTFDGTKITFYSNGASISGHQLPAPASIAIEPKPVTIGAGMNSAGDEINEHFHGLIDEVRIYNRALPAAEIAALAKATKP